MPTYNGTSGNDSWNLISPGTFTLNGGGGYDTLNLGTSLRSAYSITKDASGSVHVDSISAASSPLHATLNGISVLTFNSTQDVLDLTTYFGPPPDTTPPTVANFSPAAGATGVDPASNIVVTFSEAIQRGTGSIVLKNAAGATVESFDAATNSHLSVSGTTLTIVPTSGDLSNGNSYSVTFASGTIKDLAGNAYAGTSSYNFTTKAATVPPNTPTAGNDTLVGTAGINNTFQGSAGNDNINGGSASTINKVVYSGNLSAYTISGANGSGSEIVQKPAGGGTDTLTNIQRLQFADTNVAFDINGNAGITAKILGAVFGPASVSNQQYVGIGLSYLDGGMKYADLMQLALTAAGATTNTAVVNKLWTNLFGAAPTAAQAAPYVAMLDSGSSTPGALGVMAADLSLNTDNIHLVGLQATGIHYV